MHGRVHASGSTDVDQSGKRRVTTSTTSARCSAVLPSAVIVYPVNVPRLDGWSYSHCGISALTAQELGRSFRARGATRTRSPAAPTTSARATVAAGTRNPPSLRREASGSSGRPSTGRSSPAGSRRSQAFRPRDPPAAVRRNAAAWPQRPWTRMLRAANASPREGRQGPSDGTMAPAEPYTHRVCPRGWQRRSAALPPESDGLGWLRAAISSSTSERLTGRARMSLRSTPGATAR
jgi:hypothetical protein